MVLAVSDRQIIEVGGFFCHACLDDKHTIERSPDLRYCHECQSIISKEKVRENHRDYWSQDGQVFFTGGKGWGLTSSLRSIPLGPEDKVLEILKTGKVDSDLSPTQREVLTGIIELIKKMEDLNGRQQGIDAKRTARKPIIGSHKRVRSGRNVGHKQPNIRRPSAK